MNEKVINIIQNACALEEEISLESELKLLSLDSLSFVGAIIELEETFKIEFELDEINIFDWKTVGDIVMSVEAKLNVKK